MEVCRKLLERHGNSKNARIAYILARVFALAAQSPVPEKQVVRLAQNTVDAFPDRVWYRHTLGLALFRAGDFDQAQRELTRSMADGPNWTPQKGDY